MAERQSRDEKRSEQTNEEACSDKAGAGEDNATSEDKGRRGLKPVAEKIGEDGDNLRGREDWYRRRSGAV